MSEVTLSKFTPRKDSDYGQIEWNRLAALIATIAVLFFFTRSAPFPATTFWDLTIGRDFDLNVGWVIFPEIISLNIADSSVSLLGLKAIFHIGFFILCCIICSWVFRNREVMPSILLLAVFALSMQFFLNLRMLLTLIFVAGTITVLDRNRLEGQFGIVLIPITAAASALTLNGWILIVLVACHAFYNKKYSLTLILCSLLGLLFFPEGVAMSADPDSVTNWQFMPYIDTMLLYILSGIILLVNVFLVYRLTSRDMPSLFFYAACGFIIFVNPVLTPIFILAGLSVSIKCLSGLKPMALHLHLLGITILTIIIHIFLFFYPFGLKLNPTVRGQIGNGLSPLLEGFTNEYNVKNYEIGELAWKGLIRLEQEQLKKILSHQDWKVVNTGNGNYEIEKITVAVELN